ncbi:hypothetical protein [Nocardioides sp.]|uniref:hypothetical protein n=1 Tax=Nocardioides sp. TaxID=35761 RepID=UPI0025D86527|nr:hypothetical protein [Nocardioides sp.]
MSPDEFPFDNDDRWAYAPAVPERVTHLVFVDGRLVDAWREPAIGTEWEAVALRHDREARPPEPPQPAPHVRVSQWLAAVCGGVAAVDALTDEPLDDDRIDLPTEYPHPADRERVEATADLLDAVAERCFDAETSYAFRHALLALWAEDPDVVTRATSAAHVAAGICWAVGKANGLFSPAGATRVRAVQDALALRSPASSHGRTVRTALIGFRSTIEPWGRPGGVPDLLELGRCDLLLGVTRARLIRIRDRARAAAAAA